MAWPFVTRETYDAAVQRWEDSELNLKLAQEKNQELTTAKNKLKNTVDGYSSDISELSQALAQKGLELEDAYRSKVDLELLVKDLEKQNARLTENEREAVTAFGRIEILVNKRKKEVETIEEETAKKLEVQAKLHLQEVKGLNAEIEQLRRRAGAFVDDTTTGYSEKDLVHTTGEAVQAAISHVQNQFEGILEPSAKKRIIARIQKEEAANKALPVPAPEVEVVEKPKRKYKPRVKKENSVIKLPITVEVPDEIKSPEEARPKAEMPEKTLEIREAAKPLEEKTKLRSIHESSRNVEDAPAPKVLPKRPRTKKGTIV